MFIKTGVNYNFVSFFLKMKFSFFSICLNNQCMKKSCFSLARCTDDSFLHKCWPKIIYNFKYIRNSEIFWIKNIKYFRTLKISLEDSEPYKDRQIIHNFLYDFDNSSPFSSKILCNPSTWRKGTFHTRTYLTSSGRNFYNPNISPLS